MYRPDPEISAIVKAADKISALIKCIEEVKIGNIEFKDAEISTKQALEAMHMPEVKIFMEEFLEGFYLTLDRLTDN
jgi:5'-deoxynucleotidase